MATALKDEKIIGGVGIAAVVIFIVAMLAATFTKEDFSFGTGTIGDLFTETAFVAGCVIAGALGALFGLLITFKKAESKVFIGKVRGILMILAGIELVILGLINGDNVWVVYAFIVLIILAAAADMFYNWVADQKIIMVFSLLLMLMIALTGILSQTNKDNNILGFVFVLFVSLWVLLMAGMRFAPIEEAAPEKKKDKKAKAKESAAKKNAPTPKPYPAKKEEPVAQKKPATEKPVYKEKPKTEEPKPVEEPKKEEPKLKVMSSREAAAARETARKKEEPTPVPATAPVVAPPVETKVPETKPVEPEIEEFDEPLDIAEDTPDALLRRATWNKGLRCRRDYGEFQIPIAYVKAKVAVFVEAVPGNRSADEKLRADGWTVLRYLEKDITDGKDQAEEISKAVKENLKEERASKKKKSSKK